MEGVDVIALEEHVDYWDYLGWKDPYSSPLWSRRQSDYQPVFGRNRSYTPQMVIDGRTELPGSEEELARAAIAQAARAPKGTLQLERRGAKLLVRATALPARDEPAEVLLAVVETGLWSKVERGENAGRTLRHAPVARSLRVIGSVAASASTASLEVDVPAPSPNQRAVVFLQAVHSRRILAAATLPVDIER